MKIPNISKLPTTVIFLKFKDALLFCGIYFLMI
eukprot:SAG31_NODE_27140_length_430_cov_2.060423_1_plen_32_part_10